MEFQEALLQHFKFHRRPDRDNLPIRAVERKKWGNSDDNGRRSLAKMMADMGCLEGVEIGTRLGASAIMWCKANPEMRLTCIDPYGVYSARPDQAKQDANYAVAQRRLKPYNVTLLRERSMDVVDSFEDKSLDFVNIDGDHHFDYVVLDLVSWVRKLKLNGLIMLHDYCVFEKAGVMKAIDAYTHCHRIDPWYVTRGATPTAFWQRNAQHAR